MIKSKKWKRGGWPEEAQAPGYWEYLFEKKTIVAGGKGDQGGALRQTERVKNILIMRCEERRVTLRISVTILRQRRSFLVMRSGEKVGEKREEEDFQSPTGKGGGTGGGPGGEVKGCPGIDQMTGKK